MQYVALFAGPSAQNARLVCAVTDPRIVVSVAKAGLRKLEQSPDPVLAHLQDGNRSALEEVIKGAESTAQVKAR